MSVLRALSLIVCIAAMQLAVRKAEKHDWYNTTFCCVMAAICSYAATYHKPWGVSL